MNERGLWYRTGSWVDGEAADTIGTIYTNYEGEEEKDTISMSKTVEENMKRLKIIDVSSSDEEDNKVAEA